MAFRYDGVNWEGRNWQTVPAITQLGIQIEEARPESYPVDGTVASRAHDAASPTSDHRPDSSGDVRGIDFGGEAEWLNETVEAIRLSEDERVRYVIHDRLIFSSYPREDYPPFTWRPYFGSAPHTTHAHISVLTGDVEDDASPWTLKEDDVPQFTHEEATELKTFLAILDEMGSDVSFVRPSIQLIRDERDLPLHKPVEVEPGAVDIIAREGLEELKEALRAV